MVESNGTMGLLALARDLGERILPAFNTETGIPFHRINLEYGVQSDESQTTCVAAAGTLLIEFGVLSRLTGDSKFEAAARNAVIAIYDRRSSINLVGNTIDVTTGRWKEKHASTGAGADSFYEYLIKSYVLFGDEEMMDMFQSAYDAVRTYLTHGAFQLDVDMKTGNTKHYRVSSLQAFWPGVQAMVGDILEAKQTHVAFLEVWHKFGVLPEGYDLSDQRVIHFAKYYPLRPELVESTYLLYQATRDPFYLSVGVYLFDSIVTHARTECGFASIADVRDKSLDDRMDSFFLSETLKYLYLLFDAGAKTSNVPIDLRDAIFSTEGHPFFAEDIVSASSHAPDMSVLDQSCKAWDGKDGVALLESPKINAACDSDASGDESGARRTQTITLNLEKMYRLQASTSLETLAAGSEKNGESAEEFAAVAALFGRSWSGAPHSRFIVIDAKPSDACSEIENCNDLRAFARTAKKNADPAPGVAFLVDRGACMFEEKAEMVRACGAKYMLVANNVPKELPFAMSGRGNEGDDDGGTSSAADVYAAMIPLGVAKRFRRIQRERSWGLRSLLKKAPCIPLCGLNRSLLSKMMLTARLLQ